MVSLLFRMRWKGRNIQYSMDELSRLILGTSFFVVTVFASILGPAYPFWIVPALVILFSLGIFIYLFIHLQNRSTPLVTCPHSCDSSSPYNNLLL